MAAFILTDSQEVSASIAYVDKAGNPASVEGAPVWASSDDSVLTVLAAADGMSATASSTGKLGTAQLTVTADADLGAGVTSLTAMQDFEIIAGAAVAGNFTLGAPTEKP